MSCTSAKRLPRHPPGKEAAAARQNSVCKDGGSWGSPSCGAAGDACAAAPAPRPGAVPAGPSAPGAGPEAPRLGWGTRCGMRPKSIARWPRLRRPRERLCAPCGTAQPRVSVRGWPGHSAAPRGCRGNGWEKPAPAAGEGRACQ